MPSVTGGANWQGGSLDPETNIYYIFSNTSPSRRSASCRRIRAHRLRTGCRARRAIRRTGAGRARRPWWRRSGRSAGGRSGAAPSVTLDAAGGGGGAAAVAVPAPRAAAGTRGGRRPAVDEPRLRVAARLRWRWRRRRWTGLTVRACRSSSRRTGALRRSISTRARWRGRSRTATRRQHQEQPGAQGDHDSATRPSGPIGVLATKKLVIAGEGGF